MAAAIYKVEFWIIVSVFLFVQGIYERRRCFVDVRTHNVNVITNFNRAKQFYSVLCHSLESCPPMENEDVCIMDSSATRDLYFLSSCNRMTFDDAGDYCISKGGELLVNNSRITENLKRSRNSNWIHCYKFWICCNDKCDEYATETVISTVSTSKQSMLQRVNPLFVLIAMLLLFLVILVTSMLVIKRIRRTEPPIIQALFPKPLMMSSEDNVPSYCMITEDRFEIRDSQQEETHSLPGMLKTHVGLKPQFRPQNVPNMKIQRLILPGGRHSMYGSYLYNTTCKKELSTDISSDIPREANKECNDDITMQDVSPKAEDRRCKTRNEPMNADAAVEDPLEERSSGKTTLSEESHPRNVILKPQKQRKRMDARKNRKNRLLKLQKTDI